MSAELSELSALAKYLLHLEKEVEAAEQHVTQLKRDYLRFSREHIPDIMADIGLTEFRLDSGEAIVVLKKYYANISEDRKADALKWLRENGQEAIIKTGIKGDFGAGMEDKVDMALLEQFLKDKEIEYEKTEGVHPQTLKAFVKTQMESDKKDFPAALFGVFATDETTVKAVK